MSLMDSSNFHNLLLVVLVSTCIISEVRSSVIDITKHGAIGDGKKENSKAFSVSWDQACRSSKNNVILIPSGTYNLRGAIFNGPCKGPITFQLEGTIRALPHDASAFTSNWIVFAKVDNLIINGGGSFDGQGASAWSSNTCKDNTKCPSLPTTLRLSNIKNGHIYNISSINSKEAHFSIFQSQNIKFDNVKIIAPENSPNTDGIRIGESTYVEISNSNIKTGDDCIAMISGSQHINITGINCGPGHGISIGSLGKNSNEKDVTNVNVKNIIFQGTTNGVRIKTWAISHPNPTFASNIKFEHIELRKVQNPIIIDQAYCPHQQCPGQFSSSVKIKDITFSDIRGTSTTKVATKFICSENNHCENIIYKNIKVDYIGSSNGDGGDLVKSSCQNAHGVCQGQVSPQSCLET